jgi:hypothetical protein
MFIKLIADLDQQAAVDEHRALTLYLSLSLTHTHHSKPK